MEVVVGRDKEDMVGLDEQALGDQFDRHLGAGGKDLVELRGHRAHVIDDDDSRAGIARQGPQEADIGIQPPAEPPTQMTGKSVPLRRSIICTLSAPTAPASLPGDRSPTSPGKSCAPTLETVM